MRDDDSFKFILLNPSELFGDIVRESKCVILAGGTMEPMAEYMSLLPAELHDSVYRFSCGHIMPQDNLMMMGVGTAANGAKLDFTFANRSNTQMIDGLGVSIANYSMVARGGMVVFFSSYQYMQDVHD